MNIDKYSVKGIIYNVGMCALSNDKICFVGSFSDPGFKEKIKEILEVKEVVETNFNGFNTLPMFACINNKLAFVSKPFLEKELLETYGLEVVELDVPYLIGNLILMNNNGIIFSKILKDYAPSFNAVVINELCGNNDVIAPQVFANDRGFVVSPSVKPDEFETLEKVLKVKGLITTINYGSVFVKDGILGNNKGLILGDKTSNREYDLIYNFFS